MNLTPEDFSNLLLSLDPHSECTIVPESTAKFLGLRDHPQFTEHSQSPTCSVPTEDLANAIAKHLRAVSPGTLYDTAAKFKESRK